jgi:hypothetical protein
MDIAGTVTGIVIGGGLLALFIAIFWSDIRRPMKRPGQPGQRGLDEAKQGMSAGYNTGDSSDGGGS